MAGDVVRWMRFARGTDGSVGFGTLDASTSEVTVCEGDVFGASTPTGERLPFDDAVVLPPCQPSKIIGLWNNLEAAASKNGWARPAEPLYFLKPSTACVGHGAAVVPPASYAGRILYEGELGVVIGTSCTDVDLADVDDVIFGYTCVNDVTAFDIITEDESFPQWCRAKSFDTFAPIGPVIARGLNPDELTVQTRVGGKVRQDYPVSDMFFSPRQLVSLVSRGMTLLPGDVIACGTSTGAMPMRAGVTIEVEIPGIGVLSNALQSAATSESEAAG
jgi:2-keto-4-pentenoate hydratase/2-oxohepta-3-ene-1,7-dioic acid hydratase in catechol pathway